MLVTKVRMNRSYVNVLYNLVQIYESVLFFRKHRCLGWQITTSRCDTSNDGWSGLVLDELGATVAQGPRVEAG